MADVKVLQKSEYAQLWDRMNKVARRIRDKYRGSDRFPIGTFKPIWTYPIDEDVPESEIYFFKLDTIATNNATSICCIGMSGTFKTTLIKTLTYYNSLIPNTRIGILDLKGVSKDWDRCNYPHNNKGMLFPDEPATMNIVAGCPLFAFRAMPDADKKRIRRLNLPLQDLADLNVLTGLGFSPLAKQHLYKMLLDGLTPQQIIANVEDMYKKKKLTKPSYDNLSILLDNMVRTGFLAKKDFFDLNAVWDEGKAFALGFNNKEIPFLSVYVDKMLTKIQDRANTTKGKGERYWVVVDDCQKAFGLDPMKFPSVQTGIDALTQWRFLGINMVLGVQSPTMLDVEIYSDIKHFFIYRCANTQYLARFIPNRQIIENIQTLRFMPERFVSECIHVWPDRSRYTRFFPFNSPISA